MSTAAAVTAGLAALEAAGPLIRKILEWRDNGLSDEQILERLTDPNDVGKDLIARLTKRRERGRDLLGRDPEPG
jgi:hypothetical protein